MSDAQDPPASLEDISAGLLNGAMVILLGGVGAVFFLWQIVAHVSGWLPDMIAMTIDAAPPDFRTLSPDARRALILDSLRLLPLLLGAFFIVGHGLRHVRKNLKLLRDRENATRSHL